MKNIVILYLLTGLGHYREAVAVKAGLERAGYGSAELIYVFDYYRKFNSPVFRIVKRIYDFFIGLWKFSDRFKFFSKDKAFSKHKSFSYYRVRFFVSIFRKLARFFAKRTDKADFLENCETVICLHPLMTVFTLEYKKKKKLACNVLNIVPDEVGFLGSCYYFVKGCKNLVPSKNVAGVFIDNLGASASEVEILGQTVHPQLVENRAEILRRIHESITKKELILGLYIGLFGFRRQQASILEVISELAEQLRQNQVRIKVLTSGHKSFEKRLFKLLDRLGLRELVQVYREGQPEAIINRGMKWPLEDVNVVFSRPSEIVFYSLTCGLPHILFDPVGPQEVDMLALLKSKGNVVLYKEVKGKLWDYLQDATELQKVSTDLYQSGYLVNGALEISKHV